jgi:hypothetical protein
MRNSVAVQAGRCASLADLFQRLGSTQSCNNTISLEQQSVIGPACGDDGSTAGWESVRLWPQQQQLTVTSVRDGLFSLAEPSAGAVVCCATGPGFHLQSGTIELLSGTCIIFSSNCSDVRISDLTFEGVPFDYASHLKNQQHQFYARLECTTC